MSQHMIKSLNYYSSYEKTIIMDIDDTISFAETYSDPEIYSHAKPNVKLIETMRKLSSQGYTFILHTARGWISCNEDALKADKKYRAQIEKWLADNNVPYKELIFGKPYGILYVDDKALRPDEFIDKFKD